MAPATAAALLLQLEEARERLDTILDEEFGLQPPTPGESLDDCLTRLESLLFEAHRRRHESAKVDERNVVQAWKDANGYDDLLTAFADCTREREALLRLHPQCSICHKPSGGAGCVCDPLSDPVLVEGR